MVVLLSKYPDGLMVSSTSAIYPADDPKPRQVVPNRRGLVFGEVGFGRRCSKGTARRSCLSKEGRAIPKRETRVLQQNIIENLDGDGTLIANGVF